MMLPGAGSCFMLFGEKVFALTSCNYLSTCHPCVVVAAVGLFWFYDLLSSSNLADGFVWWFVALCYLLIASPIMHSCCRCWFATLAIGKSVILQETRKKCPLLLMLCVTTC